MTISSATLRRIASMNSAEAMAEMLLILADQEESEEKRKASQRERSRRARAKRDGNAPVTSPSRDSHVTTPRNGPLPPAPPSPLNPPASLRSADDNARARRGSRIPDDFPDEGAILDASDLGLTEAEAREQAARFRDYWTAKPGKDAAKLDWPATWRNWCRRSIDDRRGRGPPRRADGLTGAAAVLAGMFDDERGSEN